MKFEEALFELRKGKRVTIRSSVYDPGWTEYTFNFNDMMSCKWEIYNPGKSFDQVLEAFKEGKKIRRKCWMNGIYLYFDTNDDNNFDISCEAIMSNDWEVID